MKTIEEIRLEIHDILEDCEESNGSYCPDGVDKKLANRKISEYIKILLAEFGQIVLNDCEDIASKFETAITVQNRLSEIDINSYIK